MGHNLKVSLWIIALVAIGASLYFFVNKAFIPESFTESRRNSAIVAKEIVALTETSLANLDKIASYDREYRFNSALALVRGELERSKEARRKAVQLTTQLGLMARAAGGITPVSIRNLAIEAIGNEISLVSHLMVYSDSLNSLLQTLEYKFSGDIKYDASDVQDLVKNMNQEAMEINRLNNSFSDKMANFDKRSK